MDKQNTKRLRTPALRANIKIRPRQGCLGLNLIYSIRKICQQMSFLIRPLFKGQHLNVLDVQSMFRPKAKVI